MTNSVIEKIRNFFRIRRRRHTTARRPKKHGKDKGHKRDRNDTSDATDEAEDNERYSEASRRNPIDVEIIPMPLEEGQKASYFHVGGCAKECLLHGFKLGAWQLICSTATNNEIHLSTFGEAYPDAKDVLGGIEVFKQIGSFSLSQSWLTTHELLSELVCHIGSSYGTLQATIGTMDEFTLQSKLKCGFELNPIKAELVVPIYKEPLLMGYVLAEPIEHCQIGYRTVYNLEDRAFDIHAFCLGFYNGSTELGLKLENFRNLRGSIFQRINEHWAVALKANLYSRENVKQVCVGGQYDFGNGNLLKVRLREDSRIGLVYQAQVSEHLDIMYHVGFDLADPKGGAHKIAASMEFHC